MTRSQTPTVERPSDRAGAPAGPDNGLRSGSRRTFTIRKGLSIFAFLAPALIFVAIFIYYPMIQGSQMAFRNWNLNNLTDTSWVGFGNFEKIFADPVFYTVLGNTPARSSPSSSSALQSPCGCAGGSRSAASTRPSSSSRGRSPGSSSASCSAGCSTASSGSSTTSSRRPA